MGGLGVLDPTPPGVPQSWVTPMLTPAFLLSHSAPQGPQVPMVAMVTNHPDGGRHVARPHPPFVPQISNFWGTSHLLLTP